MKDAEKEDARIAELTGKFGNAIDGGQIMGGEEMTEMVCLMVEGLEWRDGAIKSLAEKLAAIAIAHHSGKHDDLAQIINSYAKVMPAAAGQIH